MGQHDGWLIVQLVVQFEEFVEVVGTGSDLGTRPFVLDVASMTVMMVSDE